MKRTITLLLVLLSFQLSAQCWEKISAGRIHNAAIKTDGTLWVWGGNTFGQLGDGTTTRRNVPTQVGTDNNWLEVTAAYDQTFAIKTDGTLWAWGQNEYYQLGDGTTENRLVPTQIGTDTNWVKVAVGFEHGIAKKSNGTIWGWGANMSGQVGDGTTTIRPRPVQIGTSNDWKTIECGMYHTLATKNNGTLWAWGANGEGRLGDGTTTSKITPIQIGTDTNWVDAAAGNYHSIALKSNGSIWCWGYNTDGQVGDGSMVEMRLTPTRVGADKIWKEISAGTHHNLAIEVGGELWGWGDNSGNQQTSSFDERSPRRIGTSQYWHKVAGGAAHTIAITNPIVVQNGQWVTQEGVLKTFGSNGSGQLGDGSYAFRSLIITLDCPSSTILANNDVEAAATIKAYPNPVRDAINISNDTEIQSLSIYNMLGQQIMTKTINAKEDRIDVSNLVSGTYFVKVMAGNAIKSFKIVKE